MRRPLPWVGIIPCTGGPSSPAAGPGALRMAQTMLRTARRTSDRQRVCLRWMPGIMAVRTVDIYQLLVCSATHACQIHCRWWLHADELLASQHQYLKRRCKGRSLASVRQRVWALCWGLLSAW